MAVNFGPGLHAAIGRRVDHSTYDRYLGRWSRLFVPAVLAAADVTAGHRILAVATGPGEAASILLLQQWEHDAISWEALPVAAQEAIIGRRKSDSEELDPKPPTSHVARTDQDRFGKIFRRNVAYGTVSDHGTIFVGFCASQEPLRLMLESMIGRGSEPSDALTSVARAVTGAYYVIPSADRLAAFGEEDRT